MITGPAGEKASIGRARRRRIMLWSLVAILAGSVLLPVGGYLYVALDTAFAQQSRPATPPSAADQQTNPRANYWRAVRQGYEGYTSASGPYTTNVLIQNGGTNWRNVRNGPVSTITPWVLAAVAGAIILFAIVRGRVKLEQRPSGKTVERWTLGERVLHWYVAGLFIVLSITGLSLLFGRAVMIPWLGLEGFGVYAAFSIAVHNYLGPFFVVGVLLMIIAVIRDALPERGDLQWLKQGGGLLSRGKHAPAGKINAGEKIFTVWTGLVVLGLAVSITGLILDFPNFGQSRETMQVANVIHAVAAVAWVALMLGHIYLGAWGVEGALDGMTKGRVSVEWAKEHHNLWYEQVKDTAEKTEGKSPGSVPRPA